MSTMARRAAATLAALTTGIALVAVAPPATAAAARGSDTFEAGITQLTARVGRVPGTAVVRGTVSCSEAGNVWMYGSLRQRQGQWLTTAYLSAHVACGSAAPHRFETVVDAVGRSYRAGAATALITLDGCSPDFTECFDDSVVRHLRIQPRRR